MLDDLLVKSVVKRLSRHILMLMGALDGSRVMLTRPIVDRPSVVVVADD